MESRARRFEPLRLHALALLDGPILQPGVIQPRQLRHRPRRGVQGAPERPLARNSQNQRFQSQEAIPPPPQPLRPARSSRGKASPPSRRRLFAPRFLPRRAFASTLLVAPDRAEYRRAGLERIFRAAFRGRSRSADPELKGADRARQMIVQVFRQLFHGGALVQRHSTIRMRASQSALLPLPDGRQREKSGCLIPIGLPPVCFSGYHLKISGPGPRL